jgi:hypothetical protein
VEVVEGVRLIILLVCVTSGFDFDYYRILLDDVRSFRTRFPSDAIIMAGDFNIELFNPVGPDERLVTTRYCVWVGIFSLNFYISQ